MLAAAVLCHGDVMTPNLRNWSLRNPSLTYAVVVPTSMFFFFSYFLLSAFVDFIKTFSIFISIFDSVREKNGFALQKSVFFIIK